MVFRAAAKDFRRAETQYDRNAVNFHGTVCIAVTVSPLVMGPDPSGPTFGARGFGRR
jgi:hypothetical protein